MWFDNKYTMLKQIRYTNCWKLNIAQAIFEKPKLLLLDEPTNALDENSVDLVHDILSEEKKRGATIIMATHNRYDIEDTCDKVLHMVNGKLEDIV